MGARTGAAAAKEGVALPSGRTDTIAGQAYTSSAQASYMGQLEEDIQVVSDDFTRKWERGDEYGSDA